MNDHHRIIGEVDAIIRTAAPVECPAWSSRIALTFAEIGMPPFRRPIIYGLTLDGLDRHAAAALGDESLVGRPVFAIDVGTIAATVPDANVIAFARDTALHELAHVVARPAVEVATDDYIGLVRSSVECPTFDVSDSDSHDAAWWRRYITLLARVDTIAGRLTPWREMSRAAQSYGYGGIASARWIAAAKTVPGYLDGSIMEAAALRCPEFDRLIEKNRKVDAVSTAASPM